MLSGPRLYGTVLTLLLLASLAVDVGLSVEVARLRNVVLRTKAEGSLQAGTSLADLSGFSPSGSPITVRLGGTSVPTLLYVFSPSCRWCARNMSNLKALQNGAGGRYRLVGVALSSNGLKEHIAEHGLDFPIVANVDPKFVSRYHLGGTPQTILVSRTSRVIGSWMGAYDSERKPEIERAIGIALPGIQANVNP
jgi:hypothetical protein